MDSVAGKLLHLHMHTILQFPYEHCFSTFLLLLLYVRGCYHWIGLSLFLEGARLTLMHMTDFSTTYCSYSINCLSFCYILTFYRSKGPRGCSNEQHIAATTILQWITHAERAMFAVVWRWLIFCYSVFSQWLSKGLKYI